MNRFTTQQLVEHSSRQHRALQDEDYDDEYHWRVGLYIAKVLLPHLIHSQTRRFQCRLWCFTRVSE